MFLFILLLSHGCELNGELIIENVAHSDLYFDEASDVVLVGDKYFIALDDQCFLTKSSTDGVVVQKITQPGVPDSCTNSDNEAIFRFPGDVNDAEPTLVVCKEDLLMCNIVQITGNTMTVQERSLFDGGNGCQDTVDFTKNKGIEGAFGLLGTNGEVYMAALIEGSGNVIIYELVDTQWISRTCRSVPLDMGDYSSISIFNTSSETAVAVVSQKDRMLWVGRILGLDTNGALTSVANFNFADYSASFEFPSDYEGVEGVFIEAFDTTTGSIGGAFVSDDQAGTNSEYGNALHSFSLTCGPTSGTSQPGSVTSSTSITSSTLEPDSESSESSDEEEPVTSSTLDPDSTPSTTETSSTGETSTTATSSTQGSDGDDEITSSTSTTETTNTGWTWAPTSTHHSRGTTRPTTTETVVIFVDQRAASTSWSILLLYTLCMLLM